MILRDMALRMRLLLLRFASTLETLDVNRAEHRIVSANQHPIITGQVEHSTRVGWYGAENCVFEKWSNMMSKLSYLAASPHDRLSLRIQFSQHPRPNGLRLFANPLCVGDPIAGPAERLVVVEQAGPLVVPLALQRARRGRAPRCCALNGRPPRWAHIHLHIRNV